MSISSRTPRPLLHRIGVAGPARSHVFQGTGASIAIIFALILLAPTTADATFTRLALPPITTVSNPGGVATDSANNLWVGDLKENESAMDQFSPAYPVVLGEKPNHLLKSFTVGTAPHSVAVESATTGDVFLTNSQLDTMGVEVYSAAGKLEGAWGSFHQPQIAIDSSPLANEMEDPSSCETHLLSLGECYVYVLTPTNEGEGGRLEKLNSKGEAVPFECAPVECAYVNSNKITGPPQEPNAGFDGTLSSPPAGVVVDPEGDIYVASAGDKNRI
jgi:hypothetical protein